MDDIVKRLRRYRMESPDPYFTTLADDAATEIERLRRELTAEAEAAGRVVHILRQLGIPLYN
jgi:hypothetical protein